MAGLWVKGQSGNPAGRAKYPIEELKAEARIHTAAALQVLVKALKHKSVQARIMAADKLLDRGWGKAVGDLDGMGGANIRIIVQTGIDRTPLPEDVKATRDVQPIVLEHEPARERQDEPNQGPDPLDVVLEEPEQ